MTMQSVSTDERFQESGEEAGTAPADRRFRPDVEGLRAIAILLVVLFHSGVPGLTGGYIGVDVFFVISGFVITGLMLRERSSSGSTSLLNFYARRCRRILPMATLAILATVMATYLLLGSVTGSATANDGRWAAAFLANFHFEQVGTNYFTASAPPSALQNYWSLSVEEQFYVVYPTLFLLVASVRGRISLRTRMTVVMVVIASTSYWFSITQTMSNQTSAYFSPFTRAWELALGALIALGTSWLMQIPKRISASATWIGFAAIAVAAFTFNAQTIYPGALVAVPVVGAALIIGGGVGAPRGGSEMLLGIPPMQWLGRRSYSLYLWHWPLLVIAADWANRRLTIGENLLLVVLALAISMVTYTLVENPIRHLRTRPGATVVTGISLSLGTIVVLTLVIGSQSIGRFYHPVVPAQNHEVVLNEIAAAAHIERVPSLIQPALNDAHDDWGGTFEPSQCHSDLAAWRQSICILGDIKSNRLMVLYGDSHALMWLRAFDDVAKAEHWRLLVLGKPGCPAELVSVLNPPGIGNPNGFYRQCDLWHQWAMAMINRLRPSLLIVTSENLRLLPNEHNPGPGYFTSTEWTAGMARVFDSLKYSDVRKVFLGNIPLLPVAGPTCLAAHLTAAQSCSAPVQPSGVVTNQIEAAESKRLGVQYVDLTPWFCSTTCTAIVGHYDVYLDQKHITSTYAQYLEVVLGQSLGIVSGNRLP